MPIELYESSIVVARPDVASCDLSDGAALLDIRTSLYYSMNAVASVIWTVIQKPSRLDQIVAVVEGEFDAAGADLKADSFALIKQLAELGLIEVSNASAA